MKILPVGAELMHSEKWTKEGQTDREIRHEEANGRFSQLWEGALK
jgi:hypothetical protein